MRLPLRRRLGFSLTTWTRGAMSVGFLVIFGSMLIAIVETESLNRAYQQAEMARQLANANDAFRLAMQEQQVGITAYAHDPLPVSASLYAGGVADARRALAQLNADARGQAVSVQLASVTTTASLWQAWADNLKATIDLTHTPVSDPTLLSSGDQLFQSFQQSESGLEAGVAQRVSVSLSSALRQTDGLSSVSITRAILAALLLTGLGLLLSRGVIVPMGRLASVARSLAAGKLMPIPGMKRTDELGDLSRALAAWQESRTQRERLFDLSVDLFCVAGGGYLRVVNGAWQRVTGYTSDELTRRPYIDFYHPDDRQRVREEASRIQQGATSVAFRVRFLCKDGSYRWLEWTAAPVVEEGLSYGVARDVTDQVSAEEALRLSGEQIRSILDNVADGIVTLDAEGRLQSANPVVGELFGYPSEELIGQPVATLIAEPDRTDFLRHLQSYLRPDKKRIRSGSHETVGRRKDGTTFPLEFVGSQIETGAQRVFIGTLRDVTEARVERADLERRLLYDELTKLPNRTLFMDRLRERISGSQLDEKRWGLMILDLDRFKEVNDSLGHDEGDRMLSAVAQRLSGALSSASQMARMGGDEFAIWSPRMIDGASASERAAQILASLEEPFRIGKRNIDIRASVGIAIFPDHGNDLGTLMRHAAVAMYLAKRRQAGWAVYSPADDDTKSGALLGLRGEVRHAINHNEFFVEYMPIVELKGAGFESVEALIRWQHPERGIIQPADFIPAVEQTELIHPLTRWVLEEAMTQLHTWQVRNIHAAVAANLSSLNLEDESLTSWLEALLTRLRIEPASLILEITETSAMAPKASAVMHSLANLGVRLSIDDFGTGYSSLAYLQRLPVDLIKIDRSFVSEMTTNPGAASIVRSVVDLAHNLGLQAVAEGVENQRTEEMLRSLGCDYAQGYYVSRPLSADMATRWMLSRLGRAA